MPRLALLAVAPLALLSACQSSDGPLSLFQQDLTLGYAAEGLGPRGAAPGPVVESRSGGRAAIRGGVAAASGKEAGASPATGGVYDVDMSSVAPQPDEVARMNAAIDRALAEHKDLPTLPIARTIEIGSIRTALKDSVEIADTPQRQQADGAAPEPAAAPASL